MGSMQADDKCASRASGSPRPKDQKSKELWTRAYQWSTQGSGNELSTFRQLIRRCGGIFQHQPLELLQQSIRLIYLLPDLSPEGLIRCIIFHDSIESSHACLSYEWNRELHLRRDQYFGLENRVILINERPFMIRENLFDFLCAAHHNATTNSRLYTIDLSTPLWIDAICIDQCNPLERNHQVRLMGTIYSQASIVHVWLGLMTSLAENERIWSHLPSVDAYIQRFESAMHDWSRVGNREEVMSHNHSIDECVLSHIAQNTYWRRAWVVQEICLARNIRIWMHTVPLDKTVMHAISTRHRQLSAHKDLILSEDFHQYCYTEFKNLSRSSLLTTLYQFQGKQCKDPRDRVYSLLSMCATDTSSIPIDYKIELEHLAYHVLHSHPGPVCLCSAISVARQLGLDENDEREKPVNIQEDSTPWIEVCISSGALEEFIHNESYFLTMGLCTSLRPVFRTLARGYLAGFWALDDTEWCSGGNEEARSFRVALRALGKVERLPDCIAIWSGSSASEAAGLTVSLGRGPDTQDKDAPAARRSQVLRGKDEIRELHHLALSWQTVSWGSGFFARPQ